MWDAAAQSQHLVARTARVIDMNEAQPPPGEPALRAIAMPADANPSGDIFGGWVLSQMDLAGGATASRCARGRVATVAITAMSFHLPVFVGDDVSCYATIVKTGRSSITLKVESWAQRGFTGERVKVTEGLFTYVAIGPDRRPRPIRPEG
jgi:acyl-CoA thioesterase YciA